MTYIWILLRQVAQCSAVGVVHCRACGGRIPAGALAVGAAGGSMAAVAGDCAPRLGTWPTLKKLGKSCQEEKGSGTYTAPAPLCSSILLDDITVVIL